MTVSESPITVPVAASGMVELLAIVLPGKLGRKAVLTRIVAEVGPVVVLVPSQYREAMAWAKELAIGWVEWDSNVGTDPVCVGDAALASLNAWLETVPDYRVTGCMTYDEFGVEVCAHLCSALSLPGTPLATVEILRDKAAFRELCAEVGVPTPTFARVRTLEEMERELEERNFKFPVVLKPARGMGNYYLRVAKDKRAALDTFVEIDERARADAILQPRDLAAGFIIEEFFHGQEVDVDGFASQGEVAWTLVSDNKQPNDQQDLSCGELGGIYPSQLPQEAVEKLEQLCRDTIRALQGFHACFHFEAFINLESMEVMPIEVNMRVGGAECPCCVEAVSGVYLPAAAGNLAKGCVLERRSEPRAAVAASANVPTQVSGTVLSCEGTDELLKDPAYLGAEFYKQKGASIELHRGSASALCWIVAGGSDAREAEANLERIISKCDLIVAPES